MHEEHPTIPEDLLQLFPSHARSLEAIRSWVPSQAVTSEGSAQDLKRLLIARHNPDFEQEATKENRNDLCTAYYKSDSSPKLREAGSDGIFWRDLILRKLTRSLQRRSGSHSVGLVRHQREQATKRFHCARTEPHGQCCTVTERSPRKYSVLNSSHTNRSST
eukprot:3456573-Amphidinium_carterae.2